VVQNHLTDTYNRYVHRSRDTIKVGAKVYLNVIQEDELDDIPDLEQELGISYSKLPKTDVLVIESNITNLWVR